MSNNKPTHYLCIVEKTEEKNKTWHTIGAGWVNDKGNITIKLNDGIVLDWRMIKTHKICLFPNRDN